MDYDLLQKIYNIKSFVGYTDEEIKELVVVTFVQQGYYLLKLLQSPEVDLYFFRFDIADHAGRILLCKSEDNRPVKS